MFVFCLFVVVVVFWRGGVVVDRVKKRRKTEDIYLMTNSGKICCGNEGLCFGNEGLFYHAGHKWFIDTGKIISYRSRKDREPVIACS